MPLGQYNLSYILITFFLVLYGVKLWYYTKTYKDEMSFAKWNVSEFPDLYCVYLWLGNLYYDQERRYEALGCFFDGLEYRPEDFRLLFNSAKITADLGHFEGALEIYSKIKQGARLSETQEESMLKVVDERIRIMNEAIFRKKMVEDNIILEKARQIRLAHKNIS